MKNLITRLLVAARPIFFFAGPGMGKLKSLTVFILALVFLAASHVFAAEDILVKEFEVEDTIFVIPIKNGAKKTVLTVAT